MISRKITNPLVTAIIIGDYSDSRLPNIKGTNQDYRSIIDAFNGVCGYTVVIAQKSENNDDYTLQPFVAASQTQMSKNTAKSCIIKSKWNTDEINDFNERIKNDYLDNDLTNFDSLIYIVSCHGDGKSFIYDSNHEELALDYIYYEFNNQNCRELRNKPKIYLLDTYKIGSVAGNSNNNSNDDSNSDGDRFKLNNDQYYQQENKMDKSLTESDITVTKQKQNKHTIARTYVKDSHYRKIFCHSGQQPSNDCEKKLLKNGSIFIQCFSETVKHSSNDNVTDLLFKTRNCMANKLHLRQDSPGGEAIVMANYSTMPYEIEFSHTKNNRETKMNEDQLTNDHIQKTVCLYKIYAH